MNETETKKIDELVEEYLQLRDEKERIKRAFADDTAPVDDAMKLIEAQLLNHLNETGLENLGTKKGTVYKNPKTFTKVADWNVLIDYVKKNDAFDLLTKNVSKDAVKARMDELDGLVIPGIDLYTINSVGIRRK